MVLLRPFEVVVVVDAFGLVDPGRLLILVLLFRRSVLIVGESGAAETISQSIKN